MAATRSDESERASKPIRLRTKVVVAAVFLGIAIPATLWAASMEYRFRDQDWGVDTCYWSDGSLYAEGRLLNDDQHPHDYTLDVQWSAGSSQQDRVAGSVATITVPADRSTRWQMRTRYVLEDPGNPYDFTEGEDVDCLVWADVVVPESTGD